MPRPLPVTLLQMELKQQEGRGGRGWGTWEESSLRALPTPAPLRGACADEQLRGLGSWSHCPFPRSGSTGLRPEDQLQSRAGDQEALGGSKPQGHVTWASQEWRTSGPAARRPPAPQRGERGGRRSGREEERRCVNSVQRPGSPCPLKAVGWCGLAAAGQPGALTRGLVPGERRVPRDTNLEARLPHSPRTWA